MTSGGGSKPAVVGGMGLALAALLAFALKHAEPRAWERILVVMGVNETRSLLGADQSGQAAHRDKAPLSQPKQPGQFLTYNRFLQTDQVGSAAFAPCATKSNDKAEMFKCILRQSENRDKKATANGPP